MGGKISILISILATITLYDIGYPVLFWIAVLAVVIGFWSWGIMHNYAMESAKIKRERLKKNMSLEGRASNEVNRFDQNPIEISNTDLKAVPNSLSWINMIATIGSLVLLISGLVIRFF